MSISEAYTVRATIFGHGSSAVDVELLIADGGRLPDVVEVAGYLYCYDGLSDDADPIYRPARLYTFDATPPRIENGGLAE